MSTALEIWRATPLRSLYRGSATAMQTPEGSVSAFFALENFDRRRGVAIYALRVINRTQSALVCRTWVISHCGDAVLAYPALFEVAPFSTAVTQIPLWPRDFLSFDRALAEIVGNGVHCIVEAAAPEVAKPLRSYLLLASACALTLVLGMAALAGLGAARPRITAFAVPPETLAGTTVQAEYGALGAGQLSYAVTAPDGRRIAGGPLDERSGSFSIAIPPSVVPGAYTLKLAMSGPLGNAAEVRVLNALVPKIRGAQIDDISVHPVVAKPGQTVDVSYRAAAEGGYVRLLDSDGTIWAQKPFARNGLTEFVVPAAPNTRELRVLLHVTKGNSIAQSMAGIVVEDGAAAVGGGSQIVGDDSNASVGTGADENGTFEVLNRTVRSGNPIRVRIISPRNGMRISLNDAQSREVAGLNVGADANVVSLRAPAVAVAARYTVVAAFTDGFGQESVVQTVTILP